jgi:hypothetical protein
MFRRQEAFYARLHKGGAFRSAGILPALKDTIQAMTPRDRKLGPGATSKLT